MRCGNIWINIAYTHTPHRHTQAPQRARARMHAHKYTHMCMGVCRCVRINLGDRPGWSAWCKKGLVGQRQPWIAMERPMQGTGTSPGARPGLESRSPPIRAGRTVRGPRSPSAAGRGPGAGGPGWGQAPRPAAGIRQPCGGRLGHHPKSFPNEFWYPNSRQNCQVFIYLDFCRCN